MGPSFTAYCDYFWHVRPHAFMMMMMMMVSTLSNRKLCGLFLKSDKKNACKIGNEGEDIIIINIQIEMTTKTFQPFLIRTLFCAKCIVTMTPIRTQFRGWFKFICTFTAFSFEFGWRNVFLAGEMHIRFGEIKC